MASSDVIAAFDRRPKAYVLGFTAAVLLAVGTFQATALWRQRVQLLEEARARAGNLTYVLAEYVEGSFAAADTSLRQLAIHARRVGLTAPADEWQPLLDSARAALPGAGSISITDARGVIRQSTHPRIVGESRSAQFIYRYLSSSGRDELVIDTPFRVENPARYVIPIGRRLTGPDGRFNGVVVATVGPEAYRGMFRSIDLGADGIASVIHPEGLILFREPSDANPIGQTATDSPVFQSAAASRVPGVSVGPLRPGGPTFVSAYRMIEVPSLIVAVSLSPAAILADWYDRARNAALAFGALTGSLAGLVFILFRQMRERTRVEQELNAVQQLEASRLREANERLESALEREQRAHRQTEEASRLKDEFLMTLSHELRTPLTAIYGWVRMLSTGILPAEQQARALAAIERNARTQTRLIDDLLEVSRVITGKLRLDARAMSVNEVVLAAADTLQPALEAKDIRLEKTLDPSAGLILADPDRVQQIVWNLLSNAIKFTPERGTVQIQVNRADTSVEIVVRDSGVGIPREFVPFVFDRFRQAEGGTRRRYGGLGLGLAIVRHLVELHGGTVSAESDGEGCGATFRVVLPARAQRPRPAPAEPAPAPVRHLRDTPTQLTGVRVLVVDDEADARELFASILTAAGARVTTAASGAEALRMLEDPGADVLLSDIEMPGMDGYELLAHVQSRPTPPRPPVAIAVTAYARAADRTRALDSGFDAHLAKPVEPLELVSAVASLLVSGGPV